MTGTLVQLNILVSREFAEKLRKYCKKRRILQRQAIEMACKALFDNENLDVDL